MIAQLRGGITVSLAERAGEIFFVRKAARKGDLLHAKAVLDQKLQRLIHTQLDDILLGGDAEVLQKRALQAGGADKALLAHGGDVQGRLAKMLLDILQAGGKGSVLGTAPLLAIDPFQNGV